MLVKCACQYCKGHIEFDAGYAGLPIVCPHCGSETKLYVPEAPLPPPTIKSEAISTDVGAGCDVLPGKWMEEPMTEKQKAMFVRYEWR
jgi:hypothetical protein